MFSQFNASIAADTGVCASASTDGLPPLPPLFPAAAAAALPRAGEDHDDDDDEDDDLTGGVRTPAPAPALLALALAALLLLLPPLGRGGFCGVSACCACGLWVVVGL